jgi:anti-anti-sigma factor
MGLTTKQSADGNEVLIEVEGRFDFHMHAEFKDIYNNLPPSAGFIIDLAKTTFIDSSALGMLLLLREYVGENTHNIRIINSTEEVRKALSISNLDKLFSVE